MKNSAIITPVLAAGSTTSPYVFLVNLTQQLCRAACVDQVPVFTPTFTLVGFSQVGTNAYIATINVQGVISYTPCGNNNCCCTVSQVVSQQFAVPFTSTTAPTGVTVTQGASINSMAGEPCCTCSRTFVSETPLTLAVA